MHTQQKGFHLIEAVIIVAVIALIGVVGYMFISNSGSKNTPTVAKTSDGSSKEVIRWEYNHSSLEWFARGGTPPKCKEPFKFDMSPIQVSEVTSIMIPGSYRGFNYKPHGGFRLDSSVDGKIEVKVPIDATLVGLTRYYEGNPAELQYLLTFETDCGIAFRFDHLHTLTPEFQAIAETTPKPKLNDTRTNPGDAPEPVAFKAGEVIASRVGFVKAQNFGFDFGVYDYRQRNEISKNEKWAEIHRQYSSLDYHGVCWFDMLPGNDAVTAEKLSEVAVNSNKPNIIISDYCDNAKQTTLDINDGQPTDG